MTKRALAVLLLSACGTSAPASVVPITEVPPSTIAAPAPPSLVPPPSAPAPVDLLHAVGTDVAVSSAYHDQGIQADHLVDGALETAWNSRTDDLTTAWIDVRLPADAEVTSLEITPGFLHTTDGHDLFTSNHRVSRVRVLREGIELGVFPIDTETRGLVSVPVSGAGGVYRIEIAEVLAGSRTDWRETCVSELRVMGRAPGAAADTRLPHTAVGALPPPRALVADHDTIEHAQQSDVAWLATAWTSLQRDVDYQDQNTGEPDPDAETRHSFDRQRTAMLVRIATLVEPIDAARADALRLEAIRVIDWTNLPARNEAYARAIDRIGEALDVVAAFLASDEARCRSARTLAGIRLRRISSASHLSEYFTEIDEFEIDQNGDETSAAADRAAARVEHDDNDFQTDVDEWSRNPHGVATRLTHHTPPALDTLAHDWTVLQAQLAVAMPACGWQSP